MEIKDFYSLFLIYEAQVKSHLIKQFIPNIVMKIDVPNPYVENKISNLLASESFLVIKFYCGRR